MVDQERRELYDKIWNIANSLRGAVDGWDFKQYVLGFLFYRYISENFSNAMKKIVDEEGFNYSQEPDDSLWIEESKERLLDEKGFFIKPSELFESVLKKVESGDIRNLNEDVSKIFENIEKSSKESGSNKNNFEGLFKLIDLTDAKLGNEINEKNRTIKDLFKGIAKMNFSDSRESDLFGDAYEYLIGMYAANAGKSGGEYFTPPEVSELLVELCIEASRNKKIKTVYDPTCGSGSLLLKFQKKYPKKIEFYGQEINITLHNLCRMNMFLHNVNFNKFEIKCGDTLKCNQFWKNGDKYRPKRFDAIVSNPPFSVKWEGNSSNEMKEDPRFSNSGALAPKNKADLAFVQHSIYHLEKDGAAAIVCFPGVLYREHAEKDIRKWLVFQNYVDAIIQLPDKLFYGTTIATCIIVLKKDEKKPREVVFIDASSYFEKAENRNKLGEENIKEIMRIYRERKDIEEFSRVVDFEEIEKKNFNLSVDTYVTKKTVKEVIDIVQLEKDLDERTERINQLRKEIKELTQKLREEFQIEEKSE